MKAAVVAWIIAALVLTGCPVSTFKMHETGYIPNLDYYEAVGDAKVIAVGQTYEPRVVPGTDLVVEARQRQLCRGALVGGVAEKQDYYAERTSMHFWMLVGGIVLLPLVPIGLYVIGSWVWNRQRMPKGRVVKVVSFEPGGTWTTDLQQCPSSGGSPAPGRLIRVMVSYRGVPTLQYDGTTGSNGQVSFGQPLVRTARIATMCGQATYTVDDITADPGYAEPTPTPEWRSMIRHEVISQWNTGTPTQVQRLAQHTMTAPVEVPADGVASFDGLGGVELEVAQECSARNAAANAAAAGGT